MRFRVGSHGDRQILYKASAPPTFSATTKVMPSTPKKAPKRYSADEIAKLHYTIRKPENPAKEKESLFGKRLVTYDQIRRKQKERRHRTAITDGSDAEGSAELGGTGVGHGNGGRGGHGGRGGRGGIRRARSGSGSPAVE